MSTKKKVSPEDQARELARNMKTRKIAPEYQAREIARLTDMIARYEVRIAGLRGGLAGLRARLRIVKRGVVPSK